MSEGVHRRLCSCFWWIALWAAHAPASSRATSVACLSRALRTASRALELPVPPPLRRKGEAGQRPRRWPCPQQQRSQAERQTALRRDTASHAPEEVRLASEEAEVAVQQRVDGVLPRGRARADGGRHAQQSGVEAVKVAHGGVSWRKGARCPPLHTWQWPKVFAGAPCEARNAGRLAGCGQAATPGRLLRHHGAGVRVFGAGQRSDSAFWCTHPQAPPGPRVCCRPCGRHLEGVPGRSRCALVNDCVPLSGEAQTDCNLLLLTSCGPPEAPRR